MNNFFKVTKNDCSVSNLSKNKFTLYYYTTKMRNNRKRKTVAGK